MIVTVLTKNLYYVRRKNIRNLGNWKSIKAVHHCQSHFHNKLCPMLPNSQRYTVYMHYINFCTKIKWKYCWKKSTTIIKSIFVTKFFDSFRFFCLWMNFRAAITGTLSIVFLNLHTLVDGSGKFSAFYIIIDKQRSKNPKWLQNPCLNCI